jgi:hypothetical protein
VDPNCQLAAWNGRVCLLQPAPKVGGTGRYASAEIADARFGTPIGTVDLTEWSDAMLWHIAGNVAVFSSVEPGKQTLSGVDLENGQTVWQHECAEGALAILRDPGTTAVFRADGILDYVDMQTGRTMLSASLGPVQAEYLEIVPLGRHDLVQLGVSQPAAFARSGESSRTLRGPSSLQPLFDGYLFSIDRQTGQSRWPGSVRVERFSVPAKPVPDAPLLVLDRLVFESEPRRQPPVHEYFVIDLRDGRLLDSFGSSDFVGPADIRALPQESAVQVRSGCQCATWRIGPGEPTVAAPAQLLEGLVAERLGQAADAGEPVVDPELRQLQLLDELFEAVPDRPQPAPAPGTESPAAGGISK